MKTLKKVLSLVMALSIAVFCLAGCGSKDDGKKTESKKSEATDASVIKIGTNAEFPPFEYVDSEEGVIDEFAGIDMEIANEIATKLNKKPEINNMDFDGLLIALENGQVDMVIAGMTVTEERALAVDFSEPYYTATQVMIVPKGSDIKSAKDIEGKKIGVIDGYTGQTCVEELGYDFDGYKKGADAIMDLANGKLDVVVIDSATAEKFIADNDGLEVVEDSEAFADEQYAIAVKKGNTELLDSVNAAIKELNESGKVAEISEKYI